MNKNILDVRINKSGNVSIWDKNDILQLMKEFGIDMKIDNIFNEERY